MKRVKGGERESYSVEDKVNRLMNRHFQENNPYDINYYMYDVNQEDIVSGYEYPNLENDIEKKIWDKLQKNANCYAFAMGYKDKNSHFPQPGFYGIPNMPLFHGLDREFTCSNYLSRLLLDNPHIYPVCHKKKCKKGYYKIFFTVAPNRDYHLYRQNEDGTYSHKPGSTPAKMTDSSNRIIKNPQTADRFSGPDDYEFLQPSLYYMTLCNSFCVPHKDKHKTFLE